MIGAMKDLAGPDASRLVDQLIENVKRSSTDGEYPTRTSRFDRVPAFGSRDCRVPADGDKTGIDGEHLFRLLQRSDSLQKLFQTERLATEGMNLIDNFMNTMLNPEFKDIKDKLVDGTKDVKGRAMRSLRGVKRALCVNRGRVF